MNIRAVVVVVFAIVAAGALAFDLSWGYLLSILLAPVAYCAWFAGAYERTSNASVREIAPESIIVASEYAEVSHQSYTAPINPDARLNKFELEEDAASRKAVGAPKAVSHG